LLLGRRYNRAKKAQGGTGANQYTQSGQTDRSAPTADTLATQHGVSEKTVRRAGKFAEEVERTPELTQAVEQGRPFFRSGAHSRNESQAGRTRERLQPDRPEHLVWRG
jgi:hypothetical protein